MEIRPATPEDVPGVLPMVAQIAALHENWDPAKYGFLPNPAERYRRWLAGRATDPRSVFLVAEREPTGGDPAKLVGFLIATVEQEIPIYRLTEFGFIHDVWVEPPYRHEGVARQMVMLAVERFREIGVAQVRLDTAAVNEAARNLFKSCGFRPSTVEMLCELRDGGRHMILCVGATPTVQRTLKFDRLTIDAVNRATSVVESSSGKSINVARMLHTLGREVLATGFLGGETGRFVRHDLSHLGIAHEFVEVEPKTRTCVTVIDAATGNVTELVEESKAVPAKAYAELLALVDANLWRAKGLVLSGSLTPDAPQDFYARCTRLARAAGVPVVLDGRGEPLRLALPEKPDVVKPNRHELAETVGGAVDTDESLRHAISSLLAKGPRWAVVTHGARDAIASDGSAFWRVTPPRIDAINPIGSGDSFAAGMALVLADGRDLPAACALGAACGAANALNSPAGHGRRDDVERLLPGVKVAAW